MPDRSLGFGIVGCTTIAPAHLKAIESTQGARLVAVCDIVEEKARALAGDRQVGVYRDYEEMLRHPGLDVVNLCTPSGLHAQMGIAAARAGKHVITEKPIDVKVASAREMIRVCEDKGVKLACIFQWRTVPASRMVHAAVQEGILGRLYMAHAALKHFRTQAYYDSAAWRGTLALDGGCLMNQGVHGIDLLQWIAGRVERVFGWAEHLARRIEAEDTAVAVLRYANGALGTLQAATSVTPDENRIALHGERGSIVLEGNRILLWRVDGQDETEARSQMAAAEPSLDGHTVQVRDMVAAIRQDRTPMVDGRSALHAVEIVSAIYESSRTGEPVTIPTEEW